MGHKNQFVCLKINKMEKGKNTCGLTSVVDSGDGVSVEHAVEEGVGVFRELQDDKEGGRGSNIHQKPPRKTHTHPCEHTTHTYIVQKCA